MLALLDGLLALFVSVVVAAGVALEFAAAVGEDCWFVGAGLVGAAGFDGVFGVFGVAGFVSGWLGWVGVVGLDGSVGLAGVDGCCGAGLLGLF